MISLRLGIQGLRCASQGLRWTSHDLRWAICDLRQAIHDLRWTIQDLRQAIQDLGWAIQDHLCVFYRLLYNKVYLQKYFEIKLLIHTYFFRVSMLLILIIKNKGAIFGHIFQKIFLQLDNISDQKIIYL